MRIAATLFLLAMASTPALAALPPHFQRQNELMAILTAAVDAFGIRYPIDSIVMTAPDVYEVTGGACTMEMRIVDVPLVGKEPGWVGPRNFAVEPGPLACTD